MKILMPLEKMSKMAEQKTEEIEGDLKNGRDRQR